MMVARHRAWLPVALMTVGCLIVWANLDGRRFMAWYLETLPKLGYLAILSLIGVAIWSVASGGGRTRR